MAEAETAAEAEAEGTTTRRAEAGKQMYSPAFSFIFQEEFLKGRK